MMDTIEGIIDKENSAVDAIISWMENIPDNVNRDALHNLLVWVDSVVEYYLTLQPDDDHRVIYPYIYIPHSESWAKRFIVYYLILKMSFRQNDIMYKKAISLQTRVDTLILPEGEAQKRSGKDVEGQQKIQDYENKLRYFGLIYNDDRLSSVRGDYNSDAKNIIVCNDGDISTANESQITEFYSDKLPDLQSARYNLIVGKHSMEDIPLIARKALEEDDPISVENIFVMYWREKPVKNTSPKRICDSCVYERIVQMNSDFNLGIKRCFIFNCDMNVFRLSKIIKGHDSYFNFSGLSKSYGNTDFVSLTCEESNLIFNREKNDETILVGDDEDDIYSPFIASCINRKKCTSLERNKLFFAFDREIQKSLYEHLNEQDENYDEDDYDEDDYDNDVDEMQEIDSNGWQTLCGEITNVWKKEIVPSVKERVHDNEFCVVVDNSIPLEYRESIKQVFDKDELTFYDLKEFRRNIDEIAEPYIVMLSYGRTSRFYNNERIPCYPNSYDEIKLNQGQHLIRIICKLTHKYVYAYDQYQYDLDLNNKVLRSRYRIDKLGWRALERRSVNMPKYEYETIKRGGEAVNNYRSVTVRFKDKTSKAIKVDDWVIYSDSATGAMNIDTLEELMEDSDMVGCFILPLEEVRNKLSERIDYSKYINRKEREFWKQFFPEIESTNIELWKMFLHRKILEIGYEQVYNELHKDIDLSENQFKRWSDLGDDMILPKSNRDSIKLLNYLGFGKGSPYSIIIKQKKNMQMSQTRSQNVQMNDFLRLLIETDENEYNIDEFRALELMDILEYSTVEELRELKQELNIQLKEIQKIR